MSKDKRNTGYDLIRIIAIFMVVANHSHVAPLAVNPGSSMWYCVLLMQTLCLVAVPLFFMVSGALLLSNEKELSVGELYKNRLPKQAVPFIVWSFVYIFSRIVLGKIPFSAETFIGLFHSPAYYQFWFMYTLLAIYLLLPVLQTLVNHCNKKKLEYILVLWAVFSVVIPLVSRYVPVFRVSGYSDLVLCKGYLGYFLLGHYLNKYAQEIKLSRSVLLYTVGAVITGICAVIEFVYYKGNISEYEGLVYQDYLAPATVISTIGAFLFFQNRKYKFKQKASMVITKISSLSIGVYYIHMLVLTAIEYAGFSGKDNLLVMIAKVFATYFISLALSVVVSKIPFVKGVLLGIRERK